jgi:glycosyltransferase involved in cell wall biosynthesis/Tfp pilus assembly protein PilF
MSTPASGASRVFPPLPAFPQKTAPGRARPVRVCIASQEFVGPTRNGGIGTAYTSLARALADAGHEVACLHVDGRHVAAEEMQQWIKTYKGYGVTLIPLPEITKPVLNGSQRFVKSFETFQWLRKHDHFDVIHFPECEAPGYHTLVAKQQGLAFGRSAICVGLHSMNAWVKTANQEFLSEVSDLGLDFMERQSVALADMVVSPSRYLLEWIAERGWQLPSKCFVQQYVLAQSARMAPPAAPAGAREITELVFFGRLETRKGVVLFCDALDRLPADAAKKIQAVSFLGRENIVYGVPAREYLCRRAQRWPWKTEIISDRNQIQAVEFIQGPRRLAVMPSLLENSPNTVYECLGEQIAFVASRVGGIPELIAPEDAGRVCFEPHPAALSALLGKALTEGFLPARAAMDAAENERAWIQWHEGVAEEARAERPAAEPARQPKVSLCLTTFNRPSLLRQAVASIQSSTYPNFEVVLVDDGSTQPEALAVLDELKPAFDQRGWRIVRQENRYLGAARNTAARNATGEYFLFMDDDNWAGAEEISTLVQAALRTGADIVTCGNNLFDGTEAPKIQAGVENRSLPLGGAVAAGVFENCFGDANALVRRSCFESLGGFTEDYGVTHEDWEFHARAVLRGFKLTVVPEFLFWYRVNPDSMLQTTNPYRNHQRSIRPYLEAAPQALQQLVLFAQGQHMHLNKLAGQGIAPLVTPLIIAWRSKLEVARVFAREGKTGKAVCYLIEAAKSAESSRNPSVILDALLNTGKEMGTLDPARAARLLQLAAGLAKAVKNKPAQHCAVTLLAELSLADRARTAKVPQARTEGKRARPSVPQSKRAPLVSVIIPCYKHARFLPETVGSVVAQTFSDWEIVIVNDGSPDDTSDVARRLIAQYPDRQIRLLENANGGPTAARNSGARAARGKYFLLLDGDDKIHPTMLAKLTPILETRPKIGFAYTHIQHFGAMDTEYPLPDFDRATLISKDNIVPICSLVRKSVWEQVGGFNQNMREGYEDWDFWIGCAEHGWDGYCLHEPLFFYRKAEPGRLNDANQKRERLIARIILNHRKLYDKPTQQWAENVLERLAAAKAAELPPPALPIPAPSHGGSPARPPLRITYLVSSILGVTGGNQTLLRQAEEMRRRGHQVTIVTYTPKPAWFQFGVRVIQSPAGKPLASSVPPSDVVVATYFTNAPELLAVKAPVKVYYAQGDQFVFGDATMADTPQNRQFRQLSRASYLLPGIRFVPNSNNLADAVQKLCGRKPDAILPVCTDQTIFRPLERPADESRVRLLIVGPDARGTTAEPLLFKGIQDIRDALKILSARHPNITPVRMSSCGPDIFSGAPCEFYIAPGDEMKTKLFGTADILIYASHYDSCPRPPQEAMAAGCAVVCTATPGAMEYCRDGENCLLVPIQSPAAIAAAVGRLIQDRPLREKLVQGGLATARQYPREREWNEWEDMLCQFMDEAAKPAGTAVLPGKPAKPANPSARQPAAITLPPCALLGHLGKARELFRNKHWPAAWNAALSAIAARPCHPEAFLLLAEIAQAAGDGDSARRCARMARDMAPDWAPPKQFLKGPLRGNSKPEWLALPPALSAKRPAAPRVSVCLIAKNEERFLPQCLRSIRKLASQIVVVDTGSTDRTADIARECGAEVHSFPWNDDFSAARNAALERATGDWILVLDADEELKPGQAEVIAREIQIPGVMAFRLPIIDLGREDGGCSYVPRLFRNAPGLFFLGRIHEQVFSSIQVRCQQWGLKHLLGKALLLHHGYTDEVMAGRNKIQRNLRLLERAIEELPDEPNLIMSLGLELVRSGNLEAGLDRYWEAFRLLSVRPAEAVTPEGKETLLTQLSTHLMAARRFSEVAGLWEVPFAKNGGMTASQHFCLGAAFMELKKPAEAAAQMRQCIAKRLIPALSPINPATLKAAPHHCLALCCIALNDVEGARRAFDAALAAEPSSRPARFDLARFHAAQGQTAEALKLARQLATENPAEARVWELGGQIALTRPGHMEFARDWTADAVKNFPDDLNLLRQRAEALMLHCDAAQALPLWRRAQASASARQRAALVLCELLTGDRQHHFNAAEEPALSRQAVEWYRHCIRMGAHAFIHQLHQRMETIRLALPAFVRALEAAHRQARQAAA